MDRLRRRSSLDKNLCFLHTDSRHLVGLIKFSVSDHRILSIVSISIYCSEYSYIFFRFSLLSITVSLYTVARYAPSQASTIMSEFPDEDPLKYITLPTVYNQPNGPDFPTRRLRRMSDVRALQKTVELENSIKVHRKAQINCDPVAHCQYWIRELCIQDCRMRLARANVEEQFRQARRQTEDGFYKLETWLKDAKIFNKSAYQISKTVLEKASAEISKHTVPFTEEELKKRGQDFVHLMHNTYDPLYKDNMGWCPVFASYMATAEVESTHIFPYEIGNFVTTAVFGKPPVGIAFSAANGLVLHRAVIIAFINLWVVIVPAGPLEWRRWKIRVVKPKLLDKYMGNRKRTWRSIDNQELQFVTESRPAVRYLYWHYVMARIHTSARKPADHWINMLGVDCWEPPTRFIMLDFLDAYIECRKDFDLDKFNDVRFYAIPHGYVGQRLEVRIAAKMMDNEIEGRHEMVIWRDAPPAEDDLGSDRKGYDGDIDCDGSMDEHFHPIHMMSALQLESPADQESDDGLEVRARDANPMGVVMHTQEEGLLIPPWLFSDDQW